MQPAVINTVEKTWILKFHSLCNRVVNYTKGCNKRGLHTEMPFSSVDMFN